ncbi:hypothetical protein BH20ACT2_BH20ACT2_07650 [soil metagenome]
MDTSLARRLARSLEPYHAMIYFVPEGPEAYAELGIDDLRAGYFASRGAALGAVPASVITATFFNFCPEAVAAAIPAAWAKATPDQLVAARRAAADGALQRLLGDDVESEEMEEAAALAREATTALRPEGRPLFAAHAGLAWPETDHLVLWHAITLLREHRGDGHLAALLDAELTACEALVLHGATGAFPTTLLRLTRAWPDEDWDAAVAAMQTKGWIDPEGELTDEGKAGREAIEAHTDRLAMDGWRQLGEDRSERLRTLVSPWSRAIVEAGTFWSGMQVGDQRSA